MAKAKDPKSLFRRLTTLFRSAPVVKRKIRGFDTALATVDKSKSSGTLLFQKSLSPTYATLTSNAYNLSERLMRYQDYQDMEQTPEIASALDIAADETVSVDDKGVSLHINSENEKIKEILEDLFYNTLNVEFNLRSWTRNLLKYGDFFLYCDVSPDHGVVNAFPIPVNEIEREENYDREDPFAVRYRWVTLGNRTLENWEVIHFRLLGNDMFLPYGSSMIEPARRIWRQLILIEDAMLVYRIVRAPERRVFYIDVANLPPEEVPLYIEEQKRNLRSNQVVDPASGRVDLRYNPMSVDEDYFLPVRGSDTGTRIDTLAGGQNTAAVEDVAYIQKKLFAALKIPRAYLGYDDALASKSTLAQQDIRFSRTINVIQKTMLAELNKLAVIHLYANGFDGEDLQNFTLLLSNPSTVAHQQKLELWRAKFEIAGTMPEGMGSKRFIRDKVWDLSADEIKAIDEERLAEKLIDAAIEAATPDGDAGGADDAGGGADLFGGGDDSGDAAPPADDAPTGDAGGETPPEENAGEEPEEEEEPGISLLTSSDDFGDDESFPLKLSEIDVDKPPIKPMSQLDKALYNNGRKRTHGASKTHMPDFVKMTGNSKEKNDPYGKEWLSSVITNPLGEAKSQKKNARLSLDTMAMLERMMLRLNINRESLISEGHDLKEASLSGRDVQDEIDSTSVHAGVFPTTYLPWTPAEEAEEEDMGLNTNDDDYDFTDDEDRR